MRLVPPTAILGPWWWRIRCERAEETGRTAIYDRYHLPVRADAVGDDGLAERAFEAEAGQLLRSVFF